MADLLPLQLGAFGVLLIVVYLVFRAVVGGQLYPKTTVEALLAARDAEILRANERAKDYRDLYETERTRGDVLLEQSREMTEVARTVEHVMESLELMAAGRGPGAVQT